MDAQNVLQVCGARTVCAHAHSQERIAEQRAERWALAVALDAQLGRSPLLMCDKPVQTDVRAVRDREVQTDIVGRADNLRACTTSVEAAPVLIDLHAVIDTAPLVGVEQQPLVTNDNQFDWPTATIPTAPDVQSVDSYSEASTSQSVSPVCVWRHRAHIRAQMHLNVQQHAEVSPPLAQLQFGLPIETLPIRNTADQMICGNNNPVHNVAQPLKTFVSV
jgi:hypothetical protein